MLPTAWTDDASELARQGGVTDVAEFKSNSPLSASRHCRNVVHGLLSFALLLTTDSSRTARRDSSRGFSLN